MRCRQVIFVVTGICVAWAMVTSYVLAQGAPGIPGGPATGGAPSGTGAASSSLSPAGSSSSLGPQASPLSPGGPSPLSPSPSLLGPSSGPLSPNSSLLPGSLPSPLTSPLPSTDPLRRSSVDPLGGASGRIPSTVTSPLDDSILNRDPLTSPLEPLDLGPVSPDGARRAPNQWGPGRPTGGYLLRDRQLIDPNGPNGFMRQDPDPALVAWGEHYRDWNRLHGDAYWAQFGAAGERYRAEVEQQAGLRPDSPGERPAARDERPPYSNRIQYFLYRTQPREARVGTADWRDRLAARAREER